MSKHLADHLFLIFDAIAISILQLNPTLQQLVNIRNMYTKFEEFDYIVDLYTYVINKGMVNRRWTYEEVKKEVGDD